eukprot:CAMPEP_0176029694 /NCGR_PEP_ID=MMETSP0120_2-20121206/14594_1 /TAXON_ID=160619 /ORGANISM="Kryptoperidinium foliaceum, Strain CCMP 1326" /LENGTH=59 /DNA_ID=CAMNT_0017362921 /DNA_START=435 /DNA_END=614 /DNA_ORIENTATION=+
MPECIATNQKGETLNFTTRPLLAMDLELATEPSDVQLPEPGRAIFEIELLQAHNIRLLA